MISKREREPSSSFEGSEEDQRERRRTFDIELILWGTNSDHSGDRSPPESVTTREITKLEILVIAAERSSVLVLARALQSLAVRRLVCRTLSFYMRKRSHKISPAPASNRRREAIDHRHAAAHFFKP